MDYFQGIVTDYLRADRSVFVNTECLIQLEPGDAPPKNEHWYCDIVAVCFRDRRVYLCEVTFSKSLQGLAKRLHAWSAQWPAVVAAVHNDCMTPPAFEVLPWVFIPERSSRTWGRLRSTIASAAPTEPVMPSPRLTYLEHTVPWLYKGWNREDTALAGES